MTKSLIGSLRVLVNDRSPELQEQLSQKLESMGFEEGEYVAHTDFTQPKGQRSDYYLGVDFHAQVPTSSEISDTVAGVGSSEIQGWINGLDELPEVLGSMFVNTWDDNHDSDLGFHFSNKLSSPHAHIMAMEYLDERREALDEIEAIINTRLKFGGAVPGLEQKFLLLINEDRVANNRRGIQIGSIQFHDYNANIDFGKPDFDYRDYEWSVSYSYSFPNHDGNGTIWYSLNRSGGIEKIALR